MGKGKVRGVYYQEQGRLSPSRAGVARFFNWHCYLVEIIPQTQRYNIWPVQRPFCFCIFHFPFSVFMFPLAHLFLGRLP